MGKCKATGKEPLPGKRCRNCICDDAKAKIAQIEEETINGYASIGIIVIVLVLLALVCLT